MTSNIVKRRYDVKHVLFPAYVASEESVINTSHYLTTIVVPSCLHQPVGYFEALKAALCTVGQHNHLPPTTFKRRPQVIAAVAAVDFGR